MATGNRESGMLIAEITRAIDESLLFGGLTKNDGKAKEAAQLANNIKNTWLNWKGRMMLYHDRPGYYALIRWEVSRKFLAQKRKLLRALEAFRKIQQLKDDDLDDASREQLKLLLLEKIHLEFKKIEINHLRKIGKIQHIERSFVHEQIHELREQRNKLAKKFKKGRHSPQLKEALHKYIHRQERKINLRLLVEQSNKAADVTGAVGSATRIISTILQTAAPIVSSILGNVPIVSSIATGASLIFNSLKTWLQNKCKTKKAGAVAAIVIAIGAILLTVLVPGAAPIVSAGLLTLGIANKYGYPWFKTRKHIKQKTADLNNSKARCNFLAQCEAIPQLTAKELHLLLKAMEETWLNNQSPFKNGDFTEYDLNQAKYILNYIKNRNGWLPSIEFIKQSNLMLKTLGLTQNDDDRVASIRIKHFLINAHQKHIDELDKKQLPALHEKDKEKRNLLIGGIVIITGAALLCVPIPLVQVAGAVIMAVGVATEIVVKYKLISKFKNWISGHSSKKETHEHPVSECDEIPIPKLKLTSTAKIGRLWGKAPIPSSTPETKENPTIKKRRVAVYVKESSPKPAPRGARRASLG